MQNWLEEKFNQGFFSALDLSFSRFIGDMEEDNYAPKMMFIAAVLSRELSQGQVCIDLRRADRLNLGEKYGTDAASYPDIIGDFKENPEGFLDSLDGAKTLSVPANGLRQATPIVFDLNRLYLYRYWNDECALASRLMQMSAVSLDVSPKIPEVLNLLFGLSESESSHIDWQKTAAAVALSHQFAVISGGPGTGKTTTVAKLLAAFIIGAQETATKLKISLAAPTGKAAARLSESIGNAVQSLPIETKIKEVIPNQALTLHRLLGARPDSKKFRFNKDNLLHLDVLILDEASMVDLPLMTRLLEALPSDARLILLGDRDQLASVEAGAVLGELCQHIEAGYTLSQARKLSLLTDFDFSGYVTAPVKINDSLCLLRHSYRFDEHSGIGQLAKAINSGKVENFTRVWQGDFNDIFYHLLDSKAYQELIAQAVRGYASYLNAIYDKKNAGEILDAFSKVRILCAVREGELGVEGINEAVRKALIRKELLPYTDHIWYVGRPVMIMKNEANLGLFNGDIGICLYDEENAQLKVYFSMPDGSIKTFLPSRLPDHQSVFAMTIHKSQGSEFEHCILLLPNYHTPVITRELIYTGVTRAKKRLDIYALQDILYRGIKERTLRVSGLGERLS